MSDQPPPPAPPKPSIARGAILGASMAVGIIAAKTADAASLPSLGYWGAFAVSLLTAAVVGGGVALILTRWFAAKE